MATRRAILKTGAAAVVIAGAAWALTRAPKRAQEPWSRAAAGFGDPRLDALAYAILAPSPHNMQPWRIRLDGEDALTVFCDPSRLLPMTDPLNRQITIGFGCFFELLRQAAAEKGFSIAITAFPEGEPQPTLDARPIGSVRFAPDAEVHRDPLFAATLLRRTNRAPFRSASVAPATIGAIAAAAGEGVFAEGSGDAAMVGALRALAKDAWRIEWTLDRTRAESIAVTRIGKDEIETSPWGLSLAGPVMEGAGAVGVLTRANMDDPKKSAYGQSLAFYERAVDTAAAFLWASTAGNARTDQIAAGRAWVRMQQQATLAGVAFHPLSQALQEFAEMAPAHDRAHELLAHRQGATVQMLARIGYAPPPPPAPRQPLEATLIAA